MLKVNQLINDALLNPSYIKPMMPSRIKAIRASYRLTQIDFSELILVKFETYRKWEQGARNPSSPGYAILYIAESYPDIFTNYRKEIITHLTGVRF